MPTDITKTINDIAQQITAKITSAMDQIVEAADLYVQALDQYGVDEVTGALYETAPNVERPFWVRLELIGRGQLDRRLLYGKSQVEGKLRKLPLSQQRQALDDGVEVLVGEGDHLIVQVHDLTSEQVRQVFDRDHVRSLAAQRAWLESQKSHDPSPPPYREPYVVRRGKVEILRPVTLTRKEVARLLEEMA